MYEIEYLPYCQTQIHKCHFPRVVHFSYLQYKPSQCTVARTFPPFLAFSELSRLGVERIGDAD